MHLRSLTLKGFKSFAAPTTLQFEPGVTAVVGQNGSGKSNVADALSWVMGEQGAKSLRGAKMDDVIFAGTVGRPALGRAEVTLVIDNADGALPIDYAEVAITRRMYRDGAGEYLINGDPCRLMDVQELLSDSGIGSQMHVVVGQNKLATMLGARPHQWRELIEEAAGVHKHRKRKERALRKLEATSGDMTRVSDLVEELRRQLKPLGRQAEAAKRAHTAGATLRDLRRRLAVAKLAQTDQAAMTAAKAAHETAARSATARQDLDARLAATSADEEALKVVRNAAGTAREQAERLGLVVERVRATSLVAEERARQLAKHADAPQLEPEVADQRAELAAICAELEGHWATATTEVEAAREAERSARVEVSEAERKVRAGEQELGQLRAQAAKLSGEAASMTGKSQALGAEEEHARQASAEAAGRAERAKAEAAGLKAEQGDRDLVWQEAQLRADEAAQAEARAAERAEQAVAAQASLTGKVAALTARIEALESTVAPADGAAWLFEHAPQKPLCLFAERLRARPGYERALAAALGPFAEALVMDSRAAAMGAAEALTEAGEGQAALVFYTSDPPVQTKRADLPQGARWLTDLVICEEELQPAVAGLVAGTVVVGSPREAEAVLSRLPQATVVTKAGALIGLGWAVAGVGRSAGVLDVRAQADRARDELEATRSQLAEAAEAVERTRGALAAAKQTSATARGELTEAAADRAVLGESLARSTSQVEALEMQARSTAGRADSLVAQAQGLDEAIRRAEADQARVQARAHELATLLATDVTARQQVAEVFDAAQARRSHAEAEHAAAKERAAAARVRAQEIEARERRLKAAQEQAQRRERARQRALAAYAVAARLGGRAQAAAEAAGARHDQLRRRVAEQVEGMREGQDLVGGARDRLAEAERSAHAAELAAATAQERARVAQTEVVERFGMTPSDLVLEFAEEDPASFDQEELAEAVRGAERELAAIGQVNPLALEEFTALEERHAFLTAQLDDLTKARKDLQGVVKEVDALVVEVIRQAYEDVSREFAEVFKTLFPGGDGSLELTDPHDLLTTGVEVKARPAGKKVQRLSLLSGGEQSLTALAVLVAIFRARPSPFYILDEVEAALDEVNLRRLLVILTELAQSAQLIIITHQRPTMEIADALYGMSMQGDGVTKVVSQRLSSAV